MVSILMFESRNAFVECDTIGEAVEESAFQLFINSDEARHCAALTANGIGETSKRGKNMTNGSNGSVL